MHSCSKAVDSYVVSRAASSFLVSCAQIYRRCLLGFGLFVHSFVAARLAFASAVAREFSPRSTGPITAATNLINIFCVRSCV